MNFLLWACPDGLLFYLHKLSRHRLSFAPLLLTQTTSSDGSMLIVLTNYPNPTTQCLFSFPSHVNLCVKDWKTSREGAQQRCWACSDRTALPYLLRSRFRLLGQEKPLSKDVPLPPWTGYPKHFHKSTQRGRNE